MGQVTWLLRSAKAERSSMSYYFAIEDIFSDRSALAERKSKSNVCGTNDMLVAPINEYELIIVHT